MKINLGAILSDPSKAVAFCERFVTGYVDPAFGARAKSEIDEWNATNNPVLRMRGYLEHRGLWDKQRDEKLHADSRQAVLAAMRVAEAAKKPPIDDLFRDVYDQLPPHLARQQAQLREHLAKHGEKYGLDNFQSDANYKKLD